MELKPQNRRAPWKKIILIAVPIVLLVAAGLAATKFKKKSTSLPTPEEAKEIVQDYLEKKSGRSSFSSTVEVSKETLKDNGVWQQMNVKYDAPPDYETIYRGIGDDLTVVDKMFASDDEKQWGRAGKIVFELCEIADEVAVDPGLAARICDAYLLPHLDKFQGKPRYGPDPEQVMQYVGKVYREVGETDRLIELGKFYLSKFGDSKRSDIVRFHIARTLAGEGKKREAIPYFREITHPSLTNEASKRLQALEAKSNKPGKK